MTETITVSKKDRDYLKDFFVWNTMLPELNELKKKSNLFWPWIYFLFLWDTLQYIWTARCIIKRIWYHFWTKRFDDIEIINTIDHLKLEKELIRKYNPPLNQLDCKWDWKTKFKKREIEELVW